MGDEQLDGPVWSALTGPHRAFAQRHGRAARYERDVARFAAVDDAADPAAWRDLAELVGGDRIALFGTTPDLLPPGWRLEQRIDAVQMTWPGDGGGEAADADGRPVELGPEDVPAMLDLTARTAPGPFLRGTVRLGGYLGVRAPRPGGALVAMAGERMATGAWREISAVCTDPAFRGRGLAGVLIRAVGDGIRARGEAPFLHVAAGNPARGLYSALGFTVRRPIDILVVRAAV